MKNNTILLLVTMALVAAVGCKKAPVEPTNEIENINTWIYDNLKDVYFWTDKIPATANKSLAPLDFFESLLYRFDATQRPDGDRFSWIQPNADQLVAALSGESRSTGAEFQLYLKTNSNELAGRILYVMPNSPAALGGIKRGDIFFRLVVDGKVLTRDNYTTLLGSSNEYLFVRGIYQNDFVPVGESKTLNAVVLQENPLHLDSVYVRGGKTIGYLMYNQFVAGPNGAKEPLFNQKMDQIFARFKARGINELILDLRYNPGGSSTASNNLASLVAKGVTANDVFARRQYNPAFQAAIEKQYGADFLLDKFQAKAMNVGSNLRRVFVLTSTRTASASELIINGLQPYMEVVVIGDKTVGKNVGSITIKDDTRKIQWGMQPIVAKSFNSLGKSDYTSGFTPKVTVRELLAVDLVPIGDLRDPLLGEAMFQITGSRTARLNAARTSATDENAVGSSIDRKPGGYFLDN